MEIKDFMKNDRFAANAGIELMEVSEGRAKARMTVTKEHLNAGGVCQGGDCLLWPIWLVQLWPTATDN